MWVLVGGLGWSSRWQLGVTSQVHGLALGASSWSGFTPPPEHASLCTICSSSIPQFLIRIPPYPNDFISYLSHGLVALGAFSTLLPSLWTVAHPIREIFIYETFPFCIRLSGHQDQMRIGLVIASWQALGVSRMVS